MHGHAACVHRAAERARQTARDRCARRVRGALAAAPPAPRGAALGGSRAVGEGAEWEVGGMPGPQDLQMVLGRPRPPAASSTKVSRVSFVASVLRMLCCPTIRAASACMLMR